LTASATGLLLLSTSAACAAAQVTAGQPQTSTVQALTDHPDQFAGVELKVTGRLTSEGNYFSRGRKIFLTDEQGRRLDVTNWAPLSVPPPRDGAPQPKTMADYLDQTVELSGVLRPQTAGGSRSASPWLFEVKSAKIVPRQP